MTRIAKLFMSGSSQAVRLPDEFHFDTQEATIRQDSAAGDVILSPKPANWDGFLRLLAGSPMPHDFLSPQERAQASQRFDPFADWQE